MHWSRLRKLTCRLTWPILGAALGLCLFFSLLAWEISIPQERLPDKIVELASIGFITLVAAWAGGWAAFKAERETQESNRRRERISAANKAIFTIATAYTAYENLRQHCIDTKGIRQVPDRALKMDSPLAGMIKSIVFNFDELSFFLDQPKGTDSTVLMELMLFEWRYHVFLQTVEHRARAVDELHLAIQAKPVANLNFDAIKTFFSPQYIKLEATTNQLIESVDTGLDKSKEINQKIQLALQQQFPGQHFLQINFQTGAAAQ